MVTGNGPNGIPQEEPAALRRANDQGSIAEKRNDMAKQVVLVTGALAGIGLAIAEAFVKKGASVVIAGRDDVKGNALEKELRARGGDATFLRADVRHDDEVKSLVDQTVKKYGHLDVAVNNAGTEGRRGPVTEQTAETYALTFDTNVLGTMLSLKHEMRVMMAQTSGSIVNISSTMGRDGAAGAALYVASKHALEGLSKSAALEGAPVNVRVNVVAPGATNTEMIDRFAGSDEVKQQLINRVPLKRLATTEEVANAVVFIASDEASFITGASLPVDGGKLI
jgi:NAD(P)-dependent dehydrogenase (short-subunit alcohol dehydrogenase family)